MAKGFKQSPAFHHTDNATTMQFRDFFLNSYQLDLSDDFPIRVDKDKKLWMGMPLIDTEFWWDELWDIVARFNFSRYIAQRDGT